MSNKGHFIVFEGGEGSGKTKHSDLLAERLQDEGQEVIITHEPGGTRVGELIRNVILHENHEAVHPRTELFLFLADRSQHIEQVIIPALEEGKTVICDRFSGSTYAYQIGGRELENADIIFTMDEYARNGLEPDVVVYLDIDPEVGIARKKEEELNRMDREELAFHRKVRAFFQEYATSQDTWVQVSSEGPKQENANTIYNEVSKRLLS